MSKDVKEHEHYRITPLRSAFGYNTDLVSEATGLKCEDPTLTQQNTREQTDINFIVQTFARTGVLPQPVTLPTYGDFSGVSDYREALELIQQAEDAFNSLPADARAHFSNNPADFLDYMENSPDGDLLTKLGIAEYVNKPEQPVSNPENKTD